MVGCCRFGSALSPPTTAVATMVATAVTMAALVESQPTMVDRVEASR
jgi:hypothetical protein